MLYLKFSWRSVSVGIIVIIITVEPLTCWRSSPEQTPAGHRKQIPGNANTHQLGGFFEVLRIKE